MTSTKMYANIKSKEIEREAYMGITLEELTKRAKDNTDKATSRLLGNYHFARKLGFSSAEANVLMGRNREEAITLAKEKGYKIPDDVR